MAVNYCPPRKPVCPKTYDCTRKIRARSSLSYKGTERVVPIPLLEVDFIYDCRNRGKLEVVHVNVKAVHKCPLDDKHLSECTGGKWVRRIKDILRTTVEFAVDDRIRVSTTERNLQRRGWSRWARVHEIAGAVYRKRYEVRRGGLRARHGKRNSNIRSLIGNIGDNVRIHIYGTGSKATHHDVSSSCCRQICVGYQSGGSTKINAVLGEQLHFTCCCAGFSFSVQSCPRCDGSEEDPEAVPNPS
mmetsp:Transcript_88643/g.177217  ORF Transcript_88643/g.177217 Transcript_88643/m.177217 type:complete len:244 (-) Transcript_88643:448-1179(-)